LISPPFTSQFLLFLEQALCQHIHAIYFFIFLVRFLESAFLIFSEFLRGYRFQETALIGIMFEKKDRDS